MKYIFIKDKDGHRQGEVIELDQNDFRTYYWKKKLAIAPFHREETLAIETQEPAVETPEEVRPKARRKRK